jgi:hypothetical protein
MVTFFSRVNLTFQLDFGVLEVNVGIIMHFSPFAEGDHLKFKYNIPFFQEIFNLLGIFDEQVNVDVTSCGDHPGEDRTDQVRGKGRKKLHPFQGDETQLQEALGEDVLFMTFDETVQFLVNFGV